MAGPYSSSIYASVSPTRTNPSRLLNQLQQSGNVQFAHFSYTWLGSEASGEIINLMELPAGAIVIPQLSSVTTLTDAGATVTMDIGEAADPNGMASLIVLSAVGQVSFTSTNVPAYIAPTPLTADTGETNGNTTIYATLGTVTTPTASVLYFVIAWKSGT